MRDVVNALEQLDLAQALESDHYFAEPLRVGNRWMASLVDQAGGGKVDQIIRDNDPWARVAMDRRRAWRHPVWGPVWVSSPEDLILAKLGWSEGTSELQLRDCRMLLRMNAQDIDRDYLTRWARTLRVSELLQAVSEGDPDAS